MESSSALARIIKSFTAFIDYATNPSYRGASLAFNGRQLTSYTKGSTNISYTYDAGGLRASKTVNGNTTIYQYVGDKLFFEQRADGSKLYFFYDSYGNLSKIYYHVGATKTPYNVLTNSQGDVIAIYNWNGNQLVASYSYDAWGNCTITQDTTGIGAINPIRYRGYYFDSEIGMYYLQSRYYDPSTGRFINSDAITDPGAGALSCNIFLYCANNPVNFIDPTGYDRIYVIYYNKPGSGFYDQAKKSPYYNSRSEDVILIGVRSRRDFIVAWNSMKGEIDDVYLYLHGGKGCLYFDGETLSFSGKDSFSDLGKKDVKGRVYLFSCHGGAGKEGNNVAWKFAKITGTTVRACTGSVSYSKFFGKYYARKAFDNGIFKNFYYAKKYVFWGPSVPKSYIGS